MPERPRLLPRVFDAALCAEWLAIAERGFAAANGAALRLSQLHGYDLDPTWQALADAGVLPGCATALGCAPACNLDQSWLRRQQPPGDEPPPRQPPHGWHQDGALHFDFIAHQTDRPGAPFPPDALLTLVTCWVALVPCGIDAPALELVTRRLDALTPAAELTDAHLRHRFEPGAFWRPALQPGDALLFGGDTLHRTHQMPSMTRTRTSVEFRFFAADAIPPRVRAERFTRPLVPPRATPQ